MGISYVFDENLPGRLRRVVQRHNARGLYTLDVVSVGEPVDLPLSTNDSGILLWCEREGRALVTLDENTMPAHLAAHLNTGHHIPGIFMVRTKATIPNVVEFLALAAHASEMLDWQDRVWYIPW
jgi:hypothetical protein